MMISSRLAGLAALFGLLLAEPCAAQPTVGDHVTPGGIAFRYAYMPRARTQSIQFGRRDGYVLARESGQGLSALGPNLVMQGPKGLTKSEFVEEVKDLRGQMYLSSTSHFTMGGVSAAPEKFEAAVELYARSLTDPALDGANLEELRRNQLTALRQAAADPAAMARHVGAYLFLPDGPLRQWRSGGPSAFEGVGIEAVERWRRHALARDGLVIAAAGPARPQSVAIQIDRLFSMLPAKAPEFERAETPVAQSGKTVVLEAPVAQTILLVGSWSGYGNTPELLHGRLAARILQKRLFHAIREKLGAAYGASAQLASITPDLTVFSMQSAVAHDKAPQALAEIAAAYANFLETGVTAEELEPEKSKLLSEAMEGLRRAPSVASQLRNAMLNGMPPDYVQSTGKRLSEISADTVNASIRERLRGRTVATIIVAPSSSPFKADCVVKMPEEAEKCR